MVYYVHIYVFIMRNGHSSTLTLQGFSKFIEIPLQGPDAFKRIDFKASPRPSSYRVYKVRKMAKADPLNDIVVELKHPKMGALDPKIN